MRAVGAERTSPGPRPGGPAEPRTGTAEERAEEQVDSSVAKGLDALSALARASRGRTGGTAVSVSEQARRMDATAASCRACSPPWPRRNSSSATTSRAASHRLAALRGGRDLTAHRLRTDGLTALEGMAAGTGESCYLGVLVGDTTVTIAERVPPGSRQLGSWIGRPYPAYCSDCGQALLGARDEEVTAVFARTEFLRHGPHTPTGVDDFLRRLAETRRRGYSIDDEEAEPGRTRRRAGPRLQRRGRRRHPGRRTATTPATPDAGVREPPPCAGADHLEAALRRRLNRRVRHLRRSPCAKDEPIWPKGEPIWPKREPICRRASRPGRVRWRQRPRPRPVERLDGVEGGR